MFGPDVQFSLPPSSWFHFPPKNNYPKALPPPQPYEAEWTWKAPIAINPKLYQNALDYRYPTTFAAIYIVTILLLNQWNRSRGNKPFGISKSPLFKVFVFVHNALLAAYSALTCVALVRAISVSVPWVDDIHGLPGTVDGLCKMNGPRGFGDAITYNATFYTWSSKNYKIHLSDDLRTPDVTDVGRIWNEGLAFWGWIFYVSKYYEVIDNIILVLKGKRVTTLQTYHHAGALLCMWAGIRYMSPPIWMFVLVNSGIHTLMYTYYTFCTVGIRPSKAIKRIITSLQIAQFVVGMTYAAGHLFVSYTAPYPVAYTVTSIMSGMPEAVSHATDAAVSSFHSAVAHFDHYDKASLAHDAGYVADHAKTLAHDAAHVAHDVAHNISSLAHAASSFYHTGLSSKSLSSAASVATDSASSVASSLYSEATTEAASLASTASRSATSLAAEASATISALASKALADDGLWLKKLLYRAAGREALAEAIRNKDDVLFGPEFDEKLIPRTVEHIVEEVKYRTEYGTVRCLDYEGQAFAIWLNVFYLLPLTGLFFRFFYKTYSRAAKQRTASQAAREAARRTSDALENVGKRAEKRMGALGEEVKSAGDDIAIKAEDEHWDEHFAEFRRWARDHADNTGTTVQDVFTRMKQGVENFDPTEALQRARESVENVVQKVADAAHGGDDEHEGFETETETEHEEDHSSPVRIKREGDSHDNNNFSQSVQSVADSVKSSVSNMTSSSGTGTSGDHSTETTPSKKHKKKKKKSGLPVPSGSDGKPSGPGGSSGGAAGGASTLSSGQGSSSSNNNTSQSHSQTTNKSSHQSATSSSTTSNSHPNAPSTPQKSSPATHNGQTGTPTRRSASPSKSSTPIRSGSPMKGNSSVRLRSLSPRKATDVDSAHRASHTNTNTPTSQSTPSLTLSSRATASTAASRAYQSSSTGGSHNNTPGGPSADSHVIDMHSGASGVVPHAAPHSFADAAKVPTIRESQTYEKIEHGEGDEAGGQGQWTQVKSK